MSADLEGSRGPAQAGWEALATPSPSRFGLPPMARGRPSITARSVNLQRAALAGPGGLIDDPYAPLLIPPSWRRFVAPLRRPAVARLGPDLLLRTVAGRTRFLDHQLERSVEGGIRQVVLLGAGYDSRSLRLARPGVRFFEVDHPATQADKRALLAAAEVHPDATFVGVDFTREDPATKLIEAGLNPTQRTFVLWEGVLFYLREQEARATLASVARVTAPGSVLAFDFVPRRLRRTSDRWILGLAAVATAALGEPFRFRIDPAEVGDLLESVGWRLEQVLGAEDLHRRYLRGSRYRRPARPFQHVATAIRRRGDAAGGAE